MDNFGGISITARRALLGEALQPVDDACVIVRAGVIESCGKRGEVVVPADAVPLEAPELTLVPGFIDAHVHIGFVNPLDVAHGGVTTVRDLGWPRGQIARLVAASLEPGFPGPSIVAAGQMVTAPGGYPTRAAWAPAGTGMEVGTPEEGRAAVASLAEWGATVVKVALNPAAGPVLSLGTLTAIVQEAHSLSLGVTGHVGGLDELDKALRAGLDELAHMLMSPDAIPAEMIERMVRSEMAVVPTMAVRQGADLDQAVDNLQRFIEAGGRVIYGTDLGNEGPRPGIDKLELQGMAAADMSPLEIIRSATAAAAGWLRLPDRGVLAPGRRADLIGIAGEPTERVEDLTDVRMVMRAGRMLRES